MPGTSVQSVLLMDRLGNTHDLAALSRSLEQAGLVMVPQSVSHQLIIVQKTQTVPVMPNTDLQNGLDTAKVS